MDWMLEAYRRTRKDGALGIDGQSLAECAQKLEENLCGLLERAKSGRYRAPAVKRVYIPKGNGEQRGLGIPTFEDKVLPSGTKVELVALVSIGAVEEYRVHVRVQLQIGRRALTRFVTLVPRFSAAARGDAFQSRDRRPFSLLSAPAGVCPVRHGRPCSASRLQAPGVATPGAWSWRPFARERPQVATKKETTKALVLLRKMRVCDEYGPCRVLARGGAPVASQRKLSRQRSPSARASAADPSSRIQLTESISTASDGIGATNHVACSRTPSVHPYRIKACTRRLQPERTRRETCESRRQSSCLSL
jgi:hypothetical protein